MKTDKRITVLLAEDHMIVREGLRKLLECEKDIVVVGEACTGHEAVAMAGKHRPDVVIMDVAMPELNGMEATRRILQEYPGIKVLVLSAHPDDVYVKTMMALGAAGYLLKQTSAESLARTIREIRKEGARFVGPCIPGGADGRGPVAGCAKGSAVAGEVGLSAREAEVLQRIAEGAANKQMAAELGISVKTVEKHRDHLMRKLGIHDTAGLTRYAIGAGIIESSAQTTTT